MRHTFTVQVHEKHPFDRWRIVYEGPVESNAAKLFKKHTDWTEKLGAVLRVNLNDRALYEGPTLGLAKRIFYDAFATLNEAGKRTWTLAFMARNGDLGTVFVVRPFEERLMGGDPQRQVSRTQFSDAP